ncbi:hypothetical protein EYF80_019158 [Liparis tanakae]|uniref:Uncharacterized protein n=1 Tax=Liparis tanakae TaxID=230148 RepID=A0A4Z2HZX4_9TELE|nr:hypothetical protein EYF80_019158 [Liparis tanakae]
MAQTNSGGQGTNGVVDESPNMIVYRKQCVKKEELISEQECFTTYKHTVSLDNGLLSSRAPWHLFLGVYELGRLSNGLGSVLVQQPKASAYL